MESIDASTTGTYQSAPIGQVAGARLLAGVNAATAIIREGTGAGRIIAALGAGIGLADEWRPSGPIAYRGALHVTLTGTSPILNLFIW